MTPRQLAKSLAMMLAPIRRVVEQRNTLRNERDRMLYELRTLIAELDTLVGKPDALRDRLRTAWKITPSPVAPFEAVLHRGRSKTRVSDFRPRYPFALERGPAAGPLHSTDPNYPYGHEPELIHLLDLLVPDDGVFLDIGSNVGYFSIYLASRPNFRGRIEAFEPVTPAFAGLRALVDALQCNEAITCHQLALSDQSGTAMMEVGTDLGRSMIKDGDVDQGELVRKATLDSLRFPRVDFLKIDVEGHEAHVLRGAEELIKKNSPFMFIESWLYEQPGEVFEHLHFLIDHGYILYLPAWAQPDGSFYVGVGANHDMRTFALVPFEPRDRWSFPSNPINIFACPRSREKTLGKLWTTYIK